VERLRLTCKQLAKLLHSQILRSISIDITKNNLEKGFSKLAALAESGHIAAQATRRLCIKSLSPTCDPIYRVGFSDSEESNPPEDILAEEGLKASLFKVIASLKGVQVVK
jgi:hypothetical protein